MKPVICCYSGHIISKKLVIAEIPNQLHRIKVCRLLLKNCDYWEFSSIPGASIVHISPVDLSSNASLKAEAKDITYYFCSQTNIQGTAVKFDQINSAKSAFDLNKETLVQIHGWLDGNNADFNNALKKAVLSKHDINVLIVDWSKIARGEYLIVKSQMHSVGKFIGEFISNLVNHFNYSLSNFKLVGHSLGAHMVGYVGKHFNGNIEQIVGLDPAGPFFENETSTRLQKTDAKFVQVIHTSSGKNGLGTPSGHADYYPNGGAKQPGCGLDLVGKCAHLRSFWFYAESLSNNEFYAEECNSYKEFEAHTCKGAISLMGGYNIDKR